MWDALRVLQMIAHVSDSLLVLVGVRNRGPLDIMSNHRRLPCLEKTIWRRQMSFEKDRIADIPLVMSRIQTAMSQSVVRLVNPIRLFELGLQATSIEIGTLLWTAGLDALTMANKKREFADRLSKFLGENELVFPPIDNGFMQPEYRVAEVVEDLYELRSEIAHGRRLGPKFLDRTTFKVSGPLANQDTWRNEQYHVVLADCACFLLRKALLLILMDTSLFAAIQNERTWRRHLL
jgi:hypothetical protein